MTSPSSSSKSSGKLVPIVLVTGLSGAGKSSALKLLEDIGYEAVDNLPLFLLSRLVVPVEGHMPNTVDAHPVAIGTDVRTRDFGIEAFLSETERLRSLGGFNLRKVFLDCDIDILCRRYTETRRRHPLAQDRPVRDGVERERELLAPLRDAADVVIDTSSMTLGELKQTLIRHFSIDRPTGPGIFVQSFSYRGGVPRDADLVFDVRFLRNPHYVAELQKWGEPGRDDADRKFVQTADIWKNDYHIGVVTTDMEAPTAGKLRALDDGSRWIDAGAPDVAANFEDLALDRMQSGDLVEDVCAYGVRHFQAACRGGGEVLFGRDDESIGAALHDRQPRRQPDMPRR